MGMFVYKLAMSRVHNSMFGIVLKSWRILIIWVESLIYDLDSGTNGPMKWSTNWDIFSVGPPLPETIGLPGGLFMSLWILGNK